MATDDQQVLVTGQASAPAMFRIPGNGQIRPKAVFASFNGTGAAVAFLPALKVISDGGETVGVYPTATSVAAGASADVSWFPRVAVAAASSAGTTPVLAYGTNVTTQTVPHGTAAYSSFATAVHTSDASKLSWSTSVVLNDTLTLHGTGFAMLTASCTWAAGTKIDYRIVSSGGETLPHDGFDSMSGYDATFGIQKSTLMDVAWLDTTSASIQCLVTMTNSDGVDSGPTLAGLVCIFYPGLT